MVESFYTVPGAPFLALLSDLHNEDFRPAVRSVREQQPELICITGNLINRLKWMDSDSPLASQPNVIALLMACTDIAPTFVSLGNHEWMLDDKDLDELSSTGATVLDNTWVEHEGLVVGGLTSGYVMRHRRWLETLTDEERSASRYPRSGGITGIVMTPAELLMERLPDDDWLEEFAETPGYHILLSHHPEYRRLVPKEVELILSGHTHGGQWRAFGRGMFSPGQGMWPKLTKGVYDGRLVVSAGLSNTAPVPRLFNPTEVVYVKG